MNTKIDYAALARAIKTSITVTEYANNVLGMNVIEGVRCVPTYRNGYNPTEFISYGDSYTDWGFPGGKRIHCDVIQLCADAHHNGDRAKAIYELARSQITADRLSVIMNDPITWDQHIKTLERKIFYWHEHLRPEDREYLHSRKITDDTINRLKIGYSSGMKRLITPYWHNGHVVYYSGRDVTGRWKTAPKGTCAKYTKMGIHHFYVENIPWGLHTLEPDHRALFPKCYKTSDGTEYPFDDLLCVLEGQVDALSFEQEGFQVASPIGGYFNEMQMPYFLSIARKIGKVFVCFDNDGAGTGFQLKMAMQLFKAKIPFVSSVVPKKIPGMPIKANCQIVLTSGSNKVNVVNSNFSSLGISKGDIIDIKDGKLYQVESVNDDASLTLKTTYTGETKISLCEITQYIKDVSDYYTAGGNLGDLVANADEGIAIIGRIIGKDYSKLRDILKDVARSSNEEDLLALLNSCTEIDKKTKNILHKNALRVPTESELVNEMIGYVDTNGKKIKGKYKLKYVPNDSFYEYVTGFWRRTSDITIKKYITELLGQHSFIARVNGTFELLKITCAVDLPNPELANYFNFNPVMNFFNGILNLAAPDDEIRKLLPHSPDYLSSNQVGYNYDPNASCKKWLNFLWDVLYYKNDEITRQKITMLQEYLAYPLFSTNPIHKMLFLLGDGRNGKGTILEVVRAIYGDQCASYVNPAQFNQDFQRVNLLNSMINICFDAERDFRASQEIIKQVVAGESIMACYKFQNHITFRPRAKLITACNNLVQVADTTRGFLSRCLFVNFAKCYEGRENFNLANELKQELPGIFNWILEGYIRLRMRINEGKGFTISDEHYELMKTFEDHISPVFMFYREKLQSFIERGTVETYNMYREYCEWAQCAHYKEMSRGRFTREFKTVLKQKHPEIFERYGLKMVKHGQVDEYDFTCINISPKSAADEDLDVWNDRDDNNQLDGEAGYNPPSEYPANPDTRTIITGSFEAINNPGADSSQNAQPNHPAYNSEMVADVNNPTASLSMNEPAKIKPANSSQNAQTQNYQYDVGMRNAGIMDENTQAQNAPNNSGMRDDVNNQPAKSSTIMQAEINEKKYWTAEQIKADIADGKYKLATFVIMNESGKSEFRPPVRTKSEAIELFMMYLEECKNGSCIPDNQPVEQHPAPENEGIITDAEIVSDKSDNYPHLVEMYVQGQLYFGKKNIDYAGLTFSEHERQILCYEVREQQKMNVDDISSEEGTREYYIWQKAIRKYGTVERAVNTWLNYVESQRRAIADSILAAYMQTHDAQNEQLNMNIPTEQ